ncbi:MAG: lipoate--protein ligase family protein [Thaumarchaeota archaeon]|nr:lipoate--protein ligase family protein [Nitrososphaerota archaeon]
MQDRKDVRVYFDRTRNPVENLNREDELFELVQENDTPGLLRFWVNSPCLIRGEARNAKYGWYNEALADELGVPVLVRSTGGGVVYHDEGNLNWSFFSKRSGAFVSPTAMFDQASKYMVRALDRSGVKARFSPPNRIDVEGRKVSGMAARSTSRASLVHGTLLLHSDLEKLNKLCIPPPGCPPVANLRDWVAGIEAQEVVEAFVDVLTEDGFEVRMADGAS